MFPNRAAGPAGGAAGPADGAQGVTVLAVPMEGSASVLASLTARWAVGRHCRVNPDTLVIQSDGWGRPYVAWPDDLGVDLSLSHSGLWVACALTSRGRVGVDVQAVADLDLAGLRPSLSAAEENLLWRRPPASRPRLLAALWTLKEADLKCRGGRPPRSLASAGLEGLGAQEGDASGSRIAWYDLDGRHLLAVCARPAQRLPRAPIVVTLQTMLGAWANPSRARAASEPTAPGPVGGSVGHEVE